MNRAEYCKSLIGEKVKDKLMKRTGKIIYVGFHNKDWTTCWYCFKWEHGAYLRSIDDVEPITNTNPIQLFEGF